MKLKLQKIDYGLDKASINFLQPNKMLTKYIIVIFYM